MFQIARCFPVVAAMFCAATAAAQEPTLEHWQGEYPVTELPRFPEDQEIRGVGYIADQETWASVWGGFESSAVPAIDFRSQLVLYARNVDFVNQIGPISFTLDEQGAVDVIAAQTLTARPIEDFVYWSAGTIPADGVLQLRGSEGESLAIQVVPEPAGIALAAVGLLGAITLLRRRVGG